MSIQLSTKLKELATATPTTGWSDFGDIINVQGFKTFLLYNTIDINSTQNLRQRILGRATNATGDTEYTLPIETIGASSVAIEGQYLEFNVDADQNIITKYNIEGIPFIQTQISCGTVGATGASITSYYNLEI